MIGEARKFPEQLRRYISTGGADKVRGALANYLRARNVMAGESDDGASALLELWRARHHYRALADENYQVSDKELSDHVERTIRLFLNGALAR
jgi:hypothetical protein